MGTSRNTIAAIATLSMIWPTSALPQQGSAGASVPVSTTTTQASTVTPVTPATTTAVPRGGLTFDLGFESRLTFDDNFQLQPNTAGSSAIFDNKLTFDLSSITANQEFRFDGSGVLRYADFPGRTVSGFEDPNLRLRYRIENSNSRLTINGRYRSVDREFLDPFFLADDIATALALGVDPNTLPLDSDGGTLTTNFASLLYETGLNAPLGFRIGASHAERDYSNLTVANPRLFDTQTDRVDATVTAKLSPVTVMSFNAGLEQYEARDTEQTERKTVDYSIGITQDINPVMVLDARIGLTKVDTDKVPANLSSSRSGTNGLLKLTKTVPRGTVFGALDSSVNQNGTQTSLRFGRDLQLPSGNLSASLGLVRTPSGSTNYIAAIAYDHALKSSDITVSLNRDVSTNNVDEDILDTRLTVDYNMQINAVSSLQLTLNYGRSESADSLGGVPTQTRTTLRAAYTRELTPDWDMSGGVTLRRKTDSQSGDANSNAVFLSLNRDFSFRP